MYNSLAKQTYGQTGKAVNRDKGVIVRKMLQNVRKVSKK